MNEKFYISTAIAYTSKKPHIGNTYEIVLADAIARFKRMVGYDVFFMTGTDEHGQKIEEHAKEKAVDPQEYVNEVSAEIRAIWDLMNCSYDKFIRTTDANHKTVVQKIFKRLYEQGDIYKSTYEGLYCIPCESFFTQTQLVDNKCPDCGANVKKTSEESYFFKMSQYQDRLLKHIEENPEFIQPESRKREMINNFLKPGLQDLCVSRTSFKWGIPVTFDEAHVVYVWIDALSNYITGLGFDFENSDPLFKKYWPCDVHLVGKDILRFHTIYWPIMLMALNIELPKQILGHPWLLFGQEKMSKSKGNVLYADDLVGFFGTDGVRYYLLSEIPYANDGNITYETFIARYNTDLANTLGNLVNRTVSMVHKYFDGFIPEKKENNSLAQDLTATVLTQKECYMNHMNDYKLADACENIMVIARRSNKYIDETMPWLLAKEEDKKQELANVLYNLVESIRFIAVMLAPILPETSEIIFGQLGVTQKDFTSLDAFGAIKHHTKVGTPTPIFTRIEEDKFFENLSTSGQKNEPQLLDNLISLIDIEDFSKVELIVAQIIDCEPIAKSNKLLQLQVDDGKKIRQVVSGIATWYDKEKLMGKKIILVSNLKPAKLRGVLSQGMILAADVSETKVEVIFVDDTLPSGSKIR